MSVAAVGPGSPSAIAAGANDLIGMLVLRKAMASAASSSLGLLAALPTPPSTEPGKGTNVDMLA